MCLSVDVSGYGRHDDVHQRRIQEALVDLLDTAAAHAGLDRAAWIRQPKGDEELSLVPAGQPWQRVVGDFCLALDALLRARNDGQAPPQWLRLRLAIDDGPVDLAANGFAGRAVVGASRLVNSRPVREALSGDVHLAVIVSRGVFQDWVGSGRSAARPEWFRRMDVREKEYEDDAWLWLPRGDPDSIAAAATATLDPDTARGDPAAVRVDLPAAGVGLPWQGAHLTGREAELAAVVGALRPGCARPAPTTCVISGMPGVGKTVLAIRAARDLAGDYPDGVIFLDLHGHTPGTVPDEPRDLLERILRRLGIAGEYLPPHLDDRTALLRERLHGRRVLLVLDNARGAAQVGPILPEVPGCGTLITSRDRLVALDESTQIPLATLSTQDGTALFWSVAGAQRLREDPAAALIGRVVHQCGHLPLAIRIAAARYRSDESPDLTELCARLDDERTRLAELDDGERSIAGCIALSVEGLPARERRLFDLLAAHPGTDFELHAAAALAGTDLPEARRALTGLVDRHLIGRSRSTRYHLHDLVAAYVRSSAPAAPDDIRRVVDYYLAAADRADRAMTPHRHRFPLSNSHPPHALPDVDLPAAAMAWFTAHERTLEEIGDIAARLGLDAQCWQLAYTLRSYFFLTKRWDPWVRNHEIALAAARRLGDRRAEALTLNNLGLATIERNLPAASGYYRMALSIFEELGDEHGTANSRANLAWTAFYARRYDEFLRGLREAYKFYVDTGNARNAAITLRGIALGEIEAGAVDDAVAHLGEVCATFERLGLDIDLAMALNALGEASARRNECDAAMAWHARACEVSERCGSDFERARAHHRLGALDLGRGNTNGARRHLQQAHLTYVRLGAPQSSSVRRLLDSLPAG
jgi:tetratricopeptide (TPR) repeat protein